MGVRGRRAKYEGLVDLWIVEWHDAVRPAQRVTAVTSCCQCGSTAATRGCGNGCSTGKGRRAKRCSGEWHPNIFVYRGVRVGYTDRQGWLTLRSGFEISGMKTMNGRMRWRNLTVSLRWAGCGCSGRLKCG